MAALAALLTSLIAYESTSRDQRPLETYTDIAGVPTVCDGITGPDAIPGKRYTHAECDALLARAVDRHALPALACVGRRLPVHTEVALAHFAYNVGVTAFCNSTAARKFRAGDVMGGCAELSRWTWVTVGGQKVDCRHAGRTCPGIVTRRDYERAMCEGRIPIPGLFAGVTYGVRTWYAPA